MTNDSFPEFFEIAVAAYAADNVASGRWTAAEAVDLAKTETQRLLPNGVATPENHLFSLRDGTRGATIGFLWFATLMRGGTKVAYMYQLNVFPQFRGRGYGRATMQALETEARALGYDALALNVFASNAAARGLYKAVGFQVTSVAMHKELTRSGA